MAYPMFKHWLCTRRDYSDQKILVEEEAFKLDRRLWFIDERMIEPQHPLTKLVMRMRSLPWKGYENFLYTKEIHHPQQLVGVYVQLS